MDEQVLANQDVRLWMLDLEEPEKRSSGEGNDRNLKKKYEKLKKYRGLKNERDEMWKAKVLPVIKCFR